MGAFLKAYESVKKQNDIDSNTMLPAGYATAYYEAMGKPYASDRTPEIGDIYTSAKEAYGKAGGGWKGAGSAILSGLGTAGRVLSTETGSNIMAGLQSNPYMAKGFLEQAGKAASRESGSRDRAFMANLKRMEQMGEDVRGGAQGASTIKAAQILAGQKSAEAQAEADRQAQEKLDKEAAAKREQQVSLAKDAFAKKEISAAEYQLVSRDPDKYEITAVPGMLGTKKTKVVPKFANEQEAEAAQIKPGEWVMIGGQLARAQ